MGSWKTGTLLAYAGISLFGCTSIHTGVVRDSFAPVAKTPSTHPISIIPPTLYTEGSLIPPQLRLPDPTADKPHPFLKGIADEVEMGKEKVDYFFLWPSDMPVLCVGEDHTVIAHKTELRKIMDYYAPRGLTHLGLEMFRSQDQKLLDAYSAGKKKKKDLTAHLEASWGAYGKDVVEAYADVLEDAKKHHLKLVAIEVDDMVLYKQSQEEIIDFHNKGGSIEEFCNLPGMQKRDEHWAQRAAAVIDKDKRMIIYGGKAHFGFRGPGGSCTNELLARKGVYSWVVKLTGGAKPAETLSIDPRQAIDPIGLAADYLHIDQDYFGMNVDLMKLPRDTNYYIHLPQTQLPQR